MHLDPLLLFLVVPLGSALGASLGHGVQAAFDERSIDFHGFHHGQEPLSYGHSFHHNGQVEEEHTVYKTLSNDPEFSRITKALNFVDDVAALLDDPSAKLTFFAPPDKALRRPDHPHDSPDGPPPPPSDPRRGPSDGPPTPPDAPPPPPRGPPDDPPHGPPHAPPHKPQKKVTRDGRRGHSSITSYDLNKALPSLLKKSVLKNKITVLDDTNYVSDFGNLIEALDLLDELEATSGVNGAEDKDKRRKVLKVILRAILHYHIIPTKPYGINELARNTTYPTKLVIPGASDGKPIRLRVSQSFLPPLVSINFFTKIRRPDVKATNGIIHVIDHPLIPPPSVFQELYLAPRFFSTLTSVLQRSELTKEVDLQYVHGEGLSGASLVTIFAPTNRAFNALPPKLQLFLFSPFGENVLRKLLQYHIVPHTIVHSNYIHHTKDVQKPSSQLVLNETDNLEHLGPLCGHNGPGEHRRGLKSKVLHWLTKITPGGKVPHHNEKPKVEPIISTNLTLDTLFVNHTLHAFISQKEIEFPFPDRKHSIIDTRVFVNRHPVIVADVVGLNGVIHVVDQLLDPRGKHHPGRPIRRHHHHHKHHPKDKHGHDDDRSGRRQPHKTQQDDHPTLSHSTWNDWEDWLVDWADEQE